MIADGYDDGYARMCMVMDMWMDMVMYCEYGDG